MACSNRELASDHTKHRTSHNQRFFFGWSKPVVCKLVPCSKTYRGYNRNRYVLNPRIWHPVSGSICLLCFAPTACRTATLSIGISSITGSTLTFKSTPISLSSHSYRLYCDINVAPQLISSQFQRENPNPKHWYIRDDHFSRQHEKLTTN